MAPSPQVLTSAVLQIRAAPYPRRRPRSRSARSWPRGHSGRRRSARWVPQRRPNSFYRVAESNSTSDDTSGAAGWSIGDQTYSRLYALSKANRAGKRCRAATRWPSASSPAPTRPYGVTGSEFANSRVTDARHAEPHAKGAGQEDDYHIRGDGCTRAGDPRGGAGAGGPAARGVAAGERAEGGEAARATAEAHGAGAGRGVLRGRSGWLRAAAPARGPRHRMPGDRAGADPQAARRPRQDRPPRRTEARRAAARGPAHGGIPPPSTRRRCATSAGRARTP